MSSNKHLIVVAGPTAAGKTAFAISLAQMFETEILSADSRQFYSGIKIGTAAPTDFELSQARHHFIGNLQLEDYYNVSIYEQEALKLLDQIYEKRNVAIVVGGSGLYINALCNGIDDLPDADFELRNSLNDKYLSNGIEWLQAEVQKLDPEYYSIVDIKNPKRLLRALEVCLATGMTYSEQRKDVRSERPFKIHKIALNLPRAELFNRINLRVDKMIQDGLVEEVKSLTKYRHLNSLNTVGYKEIFKFLDGEITLEQAITDIKTNTRRYAKRQITWFRKDPDFQWFSPFDDKIVFDKIWGIMQ